MVFPKELADELRKEEKALSLEKEKVYYDLMHDLFISADLKEIDEEDIKIIHLVKRIYHYGLISKQNKKDILGKLKEVHHLLKERQERFVPDKEENHNLAVLIEIIDDFLKHEADFLDYMPGADRKEYVKLLDLARSPEKRFIIDKAALELEGEKLKYDGKEIQGVKIIGDTATIVGQHYSDRETIRNIYANKAISAEYERYCYLVEPGRLEGRSESKIRQIVGARHADANITIKVEVPLHSCWIRVKRGDPVKFALETRSVPISAPKRQYGFRVGINNRVEQWAA